MTCKASSGTCGYRMALHLASNAGTIRLSDPKPCDPSSDTCGKNSGICINSTVQEFPYDQKQTMLKAQQTCEPARRTPSHVNPGGKKRKEGGKKEKKKNRDSRFKKRTISIEPNSKGKKTESLWVHIREKRKFQHPTDLDARLAVIST